MKERLVLNKLDYCWNCGGKLNKADEDNKYYCPKCQMDFILNSLDVTVTYQYEKSKYPYNKEAMEKSLLSKELKNYVK